MAEQEKRGISRFIIKDPKRAKWSLIGAVLFMILIIWLAPEETWEPNEPEGSGPVVTVPASDPATVITATEAYFMMEDREPYTLLDVRTESEFLREHIPGAILIPHAELMERAPLELLDRDARILLYCQTGRRSAEAGRILTYLGYTNVYDFGGIAAWPYEVVRG